MIPIIGITSLKWINAPLDITFTIRWACMDAVIEYISIYLWFPLM